MELTRNDRQKILKKKKLANTYKRIKNVYVSPCHAIVMYCSIMQSSRTSVYVLVDVCVCVPTSQSYGGRKRQKTKGVTG